MPPFIAPKKQDATKSPNNMTTSLTPGVYQHYKGKLYFVLGQSRNTETNEVCVVYRPLYETDWPHLVHRSLAMFQETVRIDDADVPRFKLIAA